MAVSCVRCESQMGMPEMARLCRCFRVPSPGRPVLSKGERPSSVRSVSVVQLSRMGHRVDSGMEGDWARAGVWLMLVDCSSRQLRTGQLLRRLLTAGATAASGTLSN